MTISYKSKLHTDATLKIINDIGSRLVFFKKSSPPSYRLLLMDPRLSQKYTVYGHVGPVQNSNEKVAFHKKF